MVSRPAVEPQTRVHRGLKTTSRRTWSPPSDCCFRRLAIRACLNTGGFQLRRLAVRAPSSRLLRGSSDNVGFAYQFAARASALVMLLASVLPTPTVRYRKRVVATEVITRALEVCNQKMVCGSVDKPQVELTGAPRSRTPSRAWLHLVRSLMNPGRVTLGSSRIWAARPRVLVRGAMRLRRIAFRGSPRSGCLS